MKCCMAGKWKEREEHRDFTPLPLPRSSLYLFLFSINFSFITRYFTTNPGFWGHARLLLVRSRTLWFWVRAGLGLAQRGGGGGWIFPQKIILDWSNQNPHLQNILLIDLTILLKSSALSAHIGQTTRHWAKHVTSAATFVPRSFSGGSRPWERGYFCKAKWRTDVHWCLVDKLLYFTTFRVKVP